MTPKDFQFSVCLLWKVWHCRNQVLHHKPTQNAPTLIQWTEDYLRQYQQHNDHRAPPNLKETRQRNSQWQPPPPGCVKLNVDVAQRVQQNKMSFGFIVRNHAEDTIAALAIPWRGIHQPLIMEAHALQFALQWCLQNSIAIHHIESSCKILIHAIHLGYTDNIHLQDFITHIKGLLSHLPQASISYIPREANTAAHRLAKQALGLDQDTGLFKKKNLRMRSISTAINKISQIIDIRTQRDRNVLPKTSSGVLIPPKIEDDHSPLPGWMIESLKAVKYVNSDHFAVPVGKRVVELVGGKESALTQVVRTIISKTYKNKAVEENGGAKAPDNYVKRLSNQQETYDFDWRIKRILTAAKGQLQEVTTKKGSTHAGSFCESSDSPRHTILIFHGLGNFNSLLFHLNFHMDTQPTQQSKIYNRKVYVMLLTLGSSMQRMASTSLSSVNSSTGMGAGPTPLACTLSPQNGWSPKNGTIVVGH
ncbi:hypothetical protein F8388_019547 [Cannabis sativa]|uniref:RNase H type-1 domain-containing protein n=1 Tax=Cannabis sativa TaxID=3483 RepID=A0A7J6FF49_CANSA|nr:hypothetical protein F8388_019547 [Cannabis sativa]